ncbi:MAG TPA: hypothetical protein H9891_03160 [Candidatus Salinicoccus stercoripullorum]|uniref:YpoC-like domain-containing protein n=1 Tax=Candidatus Salinicoccus stercoripullorum TaxID=2838756 RepID=A0A9D1TZG6_9STAP|nr:hypothetical protein [Candidatus Salinicoccus stercoripullorum]
MTMEEMYDSLLENAKNPDRTVYNRFRSGIGQHIEETVLALAPDDPGALLPLNYSERMDYIDARPCRYHSIVQLKNIYDEFNKRSASYCARR